MENSPEMTASQGEQSQFVKNSVLYKEFLAEGGNFKKKKGEGGKSGGRNRLLKGRGYMDLKNKFPFGKKRRRRPRPNRPQRNPAIFL